MPIEYEVLEDGTLVYATATGKVTEQDLLGYVEQVMADPRIKPGFRELVDASRGVAAQLSPEVIEKIVASDKEDPEKFEGTKVAVVVPHTPGFDVAKQFEKAHDGPSTVMVFYHLSVAKKWLGCEEERS